ncbi:uncharacterized protein N7446_000225 [Penicillium canescens]|nr:uncharacterized protein N7446_000225 [Penicillium canescens]KAJ6077289.1 hypothetical protein N7446_000225 [Penicillium canescens]
MVTPSLANVSLEPTRGDVGLSSENTAAADDTSVTPHSGNSLSLSALPINPAMGPSCASLDNLATIFSAYPPLAKSPKQDVSTVSDSPSLSLSALPINPLMPHLEAPSSLSTTSLTSSHSIETPEPKDVPRPPTKTANIKHTLRRVPGYESSLFVSALPINPALADLNTSTTSANIETVPPAQLSPPSQPNPGQQSHTSPLSANRNPGISTRHPTR